MKIDYEITFLSDWHCGSGLSGGGDSDAKLIRDDNGMPYIPGKTMKGLLSDACKEIARDSNVLDLGNIEDLFGKDAYIESITSADGKKIEKQMQSKQSKINVTNVKIQEVDYNDIVNNQLQNNLYKNITSTRIDLLGVADDKSLREMEVCMPITLTGTIEIEEENHKQIVYNGLQWLRAIGMNRNRGLGRCKIKFQKNV